MIKGLEHPETVTGCRKVSCEIGNSMKASRATWVAERCSEIDVGVARRDNRKAFRLFESLTSEGQQKCSVSEDSLLLGGKAALDLWTECAPRLTTSRTSSKTSNLETNADRRT